MFQSEFWVQLIVYAVSIGSFAGAVLTKIKYLGKKMDKHNGLVERMIIVEQCIKALSFRINKIEKEED